MGHATTNAPQAQRIQPTLSPDSGMTQPELRLSAHAHLQQPRILGDVALPAQGLPLAQWRHLHAKKQAISTRSNPRSAFGPCALSSLSSEDVFGLFMQACEMQSVGHGACSGISPCPSPTPRPRAPASAPAHGGVHGLARLSAAGALAWPFPAGVRVSMRSSAENMFHMASVEFSKPRWW